jgi:hypothetical protein
MIQLRMGARLRFGVKRENPISVAGWIPLKMAGSTAMFEIFDAGRRISRNSLFFGRLGGRRNQIQTGRIRPPGLTGGSLLS